MVRLYTKTGDRGTTGLIGNERVSKTDARIVAIGDIDELNAQMGMLAQRLDTIRLNTMGVAHDQTSPQVLDSIADTNIANTIAEIQNRLFDVGATLASIASDPNTANLPSIDAQSIEATVGKLEDQLDELDEQLPELRQFILPGGCESACVAHVARTVCRRAERDVVSIFSKNPTNPTLTTAVVFLNRLSDWLFAVARWANLKTSTPERFWQVST